MQTNNSIIEIIFHKERSSEIAYSNISENPSPGVQRLQNCIDKSSRSCVRNFLSASQNPGGNERL